MKNDGLEVLLDLDKSANPSKIILLFQAYDKTMPFADRSLSYLGQFIEQ
jgi:hypothetical protein